MCRPKERIPKFCDELAKVWMSKDELSDLRFSQFMTLFMNFLYAKKVDPFYYEEEKMMGLIKECFEYTEDNNGRSN